jgi:hypothetical protein
MFLKKERDQTSVTKNLLKAYLQNDMVQKWVAIFGSLSKIEQFGYQLKQKFE